MSFFSQKRYVQIFDLVKQNKMLFSKIALRKKNNFEAASEMIV